MKITNTPTDCIVVAATTTSEWDTVEFAVIKLDENILKEFKEKSKLAEAFKSHEGFYCISFFDYRVEFYSSTDNEDLIEIVESLGNEDFVYVDLEGYDFEDCQQPESRLDTATLKVMDDQTMSYHAYGKHTGEGFWTASFKVN